MELAAQTHLDRARPLVLAYTRGRGVAGVHLAEEISAVILGLAGRSLANPTNAKRIEAGAYNSMPGPDGLLLHETLTLDNFRRKTA